MMAVGYTFEIDSTVGRYWLAHGAGFDVVADRGRKVGVVQDVVLDPATQNVSLVLVRRHGRRTAKVPPRALRAVLPASRCFVIDPGMLAAKHRPPDLRPALGRARPVLTRAIALVAHAVAYLAHAVAVSASWTRAEWPPVRRAIASATMATVQALAAAVTGAAAGASRAWREAQQRRRPN
jgi:PRC-barrel domain